MSAPLREEEIESGAKQEVGVENVYEYEPGGVGNCTASATGGCVGLISSGTSQNESAFLEATPNGDDVFFLTTARLAPQDSDDAFDIYDARVCTTASPCLTPPAEANEPCGTIEQCHPPGATEQVGVGATGSATFTGPADSTPPAVTPKREVKSVKKVSAKPLTRAQKLTRALRACRKKHPHAAKKRQACEASAKRLYGVHSPHGKKTLRRGRR
jgi:hypothetical protein